MSLEYRTRGQSSPQGKPRVYFCCHPEDRDRYFDKITEEILKLQNCAIWFEDDVGYALDDNRRDELKDMQLFVMPVTSRLLREENRGLEEFHFAVDQKIPVLPLMQEPELVERFNKVCGDLQFLDPYDRDPTAIPYGEKLKKYLNSVLVGDELAQQVRDAFDAYVFLSYRKKDRKQAQELMRLIHSNDFCRDVAIWYDEFLAPGENFNQAIEEAMKKSRLFALNVTPSLLEDPNYIKTHEYPTAADARLPVLPVETEPTDRAALEGLYQAIPACVDVQDGAALSQALLEGLRGIALREKKDDPKHTYFIGLAYLNGIDVEVDRERGVKLITQAAEGGLPEAMERLAKMYGSGAGPSRAKEEREQERETGVYWWERLTEVYQAAYNKEHSEESGLALAEALDQMAFATSQLKKEKSRKDRVQRRITAEVMNEATDGLFPVRSRLEDEAPPAWETPKALYLRGVGLCRDLTQNNSGIKAWKARIRAYRGLGSEIFMETIWADECLTDYLEELWNIPAWILETDDEEILRELSTSYSLAEIIIRLRSAGCMDEHTAVQLDSDTQRRLELLQRIGELGGDVQWDIAGCYQSFGDTREALEEKEAAKKYYQQALGIWYQKLREDDNTSFDIYNLLHYHLDHVSTCDERKENWLRFLEVLIPKNGEDEEKNAYLLQRCYSTLAELENDPVQTEKYIEKQINLLQKEGQRDSENIDVRAELGRCYCVLAKKSLSLGQLRQAKKYYLQSQRFWEAAVDLGGEQFNSLKLSVVENYMALSNICIELAEQKEAESFHRSAKERYPAYYRIYELTGQDDT